MSKYHKTKSIAKGILKRKNNTLLYNILTYTLPLERNIEKPQQLYMDKSILDKINKFKNK